MHKTYMGAVEVCKEEKAEYGNNKATSERTLKRASRYSMGSTTSQSGNIR